MRRVRLIVGPSERDVTVLSLLSGRGGLEAPTLERLFLSGGVTVNRRRARPTDRLAPRDEVIAVLEAHGRASAGPPPLAAERLLLVDPHLIAVDKPAGIPAQGTELDAQAGLDAALARLLAERRDQNRFVGLVHRLDLETTGVTLFARTDEALRSLHAAFREGRVEKTYRALVAGVPAWTEHTVDAPLGPDPSRKGSQRVDPKGAPARTRLRVLERIEGHGLAVSLVEARPETGRTHQIRVHCAHVGLPLLGDRRYGGPLALTAADGTRLTCPRVALHALALGAPHPAGGRLRVEAPWAPDLARLAQALHSAAETGSERPREA